MQDILHWVQRAAPYALLVIVAAVIVVSHTPVGAALSMDSLFYLSTAENILAGNGIVYENFSLSGPAYTPTAFWPPLYAIVLAGTTWLAGLAGLSDVAAISVFNFLALTVTSILMYQIALRTTSVPIAIVVAIAVALSPSLQIVHTYAWSEPLFVPLCLAAYLALQKYLTDGETPGRLALAVLLFALATYTRYVGLAFFAAAGLAVLLFGSGTLLDRLRKAVMAGFAYVVILIPLFVRNIAVSGSLSGGDRDLPDWDLMADIGRLSWFLYLELVNLPIALAAIIALVSVGALAWLLFRDRIDPDASASDRRPDIALPLLFAGCYLVFLLAARSRQTINLDSRMLSVIIPFVLLGAAAAYQRLTIRTGAPRSALPFVLPLIAFIFNATNTYASIQTSWRDLDEPGPVLGLTYLSVTGRQLDTLRSINEYFAPASGDIVLTDIERPLIVKRIFRAADVRRMPELPDEDGLAALQEPLSRSGIAIVSSNSWSEALSKALEGRAEFFRIESQSGGLQFIVIQLPVGAP